MKNIDMTTGNITKKLLFFTAPIFLGNLFQQFYNMADTIIVGRFLGKEALAAVGASFAVMVFINSILIGFCMGAGVLFAQLYGSRKHQEFSKAISVSFVFITIVSIVLTVLFLVFLSPLLKLFRVPHDAMQLTKDYLFIILFGIVFVFLYNFAAAILRAVADSKTPLYFLIVAAITNIVLDIILVRYTSLHVKGAAYATVISQIISAVPLFVYTLRKLKFVKLEITLQKDMLKKVASYSVLTSIQQSIMNFGILMVQGLVNSFGVVPMAAFAAGVKIDTFAYMPA